MDTNRETVHVKEMFWFIVWQHYVNYCMCNASTTVLQAGLVTSEDNLCVATL